MWADESVFYHIYPLGFCEAPSVNDFISSPVSRINKIYDWVPHLKDIGINALYLGPIFESSNHGYDTKDYLQIDRRLGINQDFKDLVVYLHQEGIKVIIDAVFNHVGRDFFAFEDVKRLKGLSRYSSWFRINFNQNNRYNDGFCYEGWDGCDNLVKLNLSNPEVKSYLLSVVAKWVDEFGIDGLRLDVAHYLSSGFLHELNQMCKERKPDFWLMGEMVFGNYCRLVNSRMLNSCTNYELYKALHSSCNNLNMFELAHTLKRQFGNEGVYKGLNLYGFVDNHDVSRIASLLKNPNHLKPIYGLLFTLPAIPAIYYGSEWGATGCKEQGDSQIRQSFDTPQNNDLSTHIAWWSNFRKHSKILAYGDYKEIEVRSQILVFSRTWQENQLVIAVNIDENPQNIRVNGKEYRISPYSISLF